MLVIVELLKEWCNSDIYTPKLDRLVINVLRNLLTRTKYVIFCTYGNSAS